MTKATEIKEAGDIEFFFDRDGLPIAGFTCQVQMKQFPDDVATISVFAEEDPGGLSWSGILTTSETTKLKPGEWFLNALLVNTVTGQRRQITGSPSRVHVGKTWFV